MGQPVEPTPGAPAPDPTPQDPSATAPSGTVTPLAMPPTRTTSPADPKPTEAVDISALPANVQHLISTLRADAQKARLTPRQAAEAARQEMAAQVAKALGLATDAPPDPAELAQQVEQARNAAWATTVELQVFRIAGQLGADPDKLLDSRSFIDTLDDLVDLDPSSAEFKTALQAKVQEAAAKYPAAQAPGAPNGPRPDPSQGNRGGQPARPASLGQALSAHYAAKRT